MANNYFRIQLSQVPEALEYSVTQLCFTNGATGVTEALQFKQPDLTYDPSIVSTGYHVLDSFFTNKPEPTFFTELKALNGHIQWQIYEEETKDWLAEWKKGFVAFPLVSKYWVVPSWLTPPEDCGKALMIDPGMAFGTGTHATTQMMAFLLHKLCLENKTSIENWSMLDVGTGTAILAILAEFMGMGLVTGIEIDPEARRVALENVKLNHCANVDISDKMVEDVRGPYEVVVANIIDGVLLRIRRDLFRVLKPGGHLLVTGILEERDSEFFEKFTAGTNLHVIRRIEKAEWVGYWFQASETPNTSLEGS